MQDAPRWALSQYCSSFSGVDPDQWEATCLVRHPDDDLWGAEAFSEHYSITERDTAEVAMQDAAQRTLSQYCSLFSGVADGLDLKYYPCRSTGSAGGVIASPVGEGNPRLNSMVNLASVLNTELDHALDELGKVWAEVAELRAECAARHYLDGGSPAPVGIQHPSWARFGRRLQNCVLSVQHATIWMVVLPPLSGFNTLTVHRPVVASTMVPQTAGPG